MDKKTLDMAVQLRHELHMHPELSNQEYWTKAHLMEFLKANTSLEVVDRGAWFYACHRGKDGGRKIGFRADFDALPIEETIDLPYGSTIPGVSHKCGHDGHSAALAAFAVEIDRLGCDNTIFCIFQHAEETGDGAKECVALVNEEGIDEVFGWHNEPELPLGTICINDGAFQCASTGMSLFFEGVSSHASDPGVGRNPAPAISRIVLALPSLFRAEDYKGLVLATVINIDVGEVAFGTSAHKGVLRLTIRGQYEAEMEQLRAKIDTLAFGLASEYGLTYHAEYCDSFPETANHKESADKVREICKNKNIPCTKFLYPKRGSEDFGHFTKATKGAYFDVGMGEPASPHHTVTFDFKDEIMPIGVDIFLELANMK